MNYLKQFPEEIQVQVLRDMLVQDFLDEQLKMINYEPSLIQFIKDPSEKLQLAAVTECPYAIEFIEDPSEKVQLVVITKKPYILHWIKNPFEKVKLVAKRKMNVF